MSSHWLVDTAIRRTGSFLVCLCVFAGLFGPHLACGAPIIFQRSLVVDRSVNIFDTTVFDFDLVLSRSFSAGTSSESLRLFDDVTISPEDVGRTFIVNRENSPVFAAAATRLADSLDEFVLLELREIASGRAEKQGWQERRFFLKSASDDAPDLAGKLLSSIELQIDAFHLTANGPSSTPNGIAVPPVQLLATLRFVAIPEPSALVGSLTSALALVYSRNGRSGKKNLLLRTKR